MDKNLQLIYDQICCRSPNKNYSIDNMHWISIERYFNNSQQYRDWFTMLMGLCLHKLHFTILFGSVAIYKFNLIDMNFERLSTQNSTIFHWQVVSNPYQKCINHIAYYAFFCYTPGIQRILMLILNGEQTALQLKYFWNLRSFLHLVVVIWMFV